MITNRIHIERAERRMSQEELAVAVGVTKQTISGIERGKYLPSIELAFKISDVFDKEINEIFFYHKEE